MEVIVAHNFEKYALEGNEFIKQVAVALNRPEDKDYAYRVTTAVFHALRDRITPEESLHLISQLPMFLKAVYVEGWKLSETPKKFESADEFLEEIRHQNKRSADKDFADDEVGIEAILTVFSVLKKHISAGEMNDVRDQLPKGIAELWQ